MAIVGRARTATGAGVIATVLLVLAFGNQAFTEWVGRHTDGNTVWGWFLRTLAWPAWTVRSTAPVRDLLAFVASHSSWLGAFEAAGDGSKYGLFVGWLVGIAVAGAKSRVAAAT